MLAIEQGKGLTTASNRKILVYVDGAGKDVNVLEAAAKMAIEDGAELVVMTVLKKVNRVPDEFIKFVNSERFTDPPHYLYYQYLGRAVLEPYVERLRTMNVSYEVQIEFGDKKERIEAVAKAIKPYRVVMSVNGGIRKRFFGLPLLGAGKGLRLDCPITLIP
ncbi:MAG: universal stress protein [Nitrososphaerota archaeon]